MIKRGIIITGIMMLMVFTPMTAQAGTPYDMTDWTEKWEEGNFIFFKNTRYVAWNMESQDMTLSMIHNMVFDGYNNTHWLANFNLLTVNLTIAQLYFENGSVVQRGTEFVDVYLIYDERELAYMNMTDGDGFFRVYNWKKDFDVLLAESPEGVSFSWEHTYYLNSSSEVFTVFLELAYTYIVTVENRPIPEYTIPVLIVGGIILITFISRNKIKEQIEKWQRPKDLTKPKRTGKERNVIKGHRQKKHKDRDGYKKRDRGYNKRRR